MVKSKKISSHSTPISKAKNISRRWNKQFIYDEESETDSPNSTLNIEIPLQFPFQIAETMQANSQIVNTTSFPFIAPIVEPIVPPMVGGEPIKLGMFLKGEDNQVSANRDLSVAWDQNATIYEVSIEWLNN